MSRRALAAGLLLVGGLLIAESVRHPVPDKFRTFAVACVVAGGIGFNVVSLLRRDLNIRLGFRLLVGATGTLLLIGVLAARHSMVASALPSVPQSDVALRATLHAWQSSLLHLAMSLGYLVVSIAALPWPKSPKPDTMP
jgi:hypothetical protein